MSIPLTEAKLSQSQQTNILSMDNNQSSVDQKDSDETIEVRQETCEPSKEPPVNILVFYFAMIFTTPFMMFNGWVPALWIHGYAILFFYKYCAWNKWLYYFSYLPVSLGFLIAAGQIIDNGSFPASMFFMITIPFAIVDSVFKFIILKLTFFSFQNYESGWRAWFLTLVFPTLWVGWEKLLSLTPLSTISATFLSQVENPLTIYLCAFFSSYFLTFVPLWVASVFFLHWTKPQIFACQQRYLLITACVLLIMAIPGSQATRYYSHGNSEKNFRVSCLPKVPSLDAIYPELTKQSELILIPEKHGDDLELQLKDKEDKLTEDQIIIAYGFGHHMKIVDLSKPQKDRTLYFFEKQNPVPSQLGQWVPDGKFPSSVETRMGSMSGAICYDFSNEETIRKTSGVSGVDLLINVSLTWGAFSTGIAKSDRLRGIENGAWVVKCDSTGEVMYSNPYGEIYYQRDPNPSGENVSFTISKPKKVFTFFRYGGFIFPWICLCFFLLALIFATIIFHQANHHLALFSPHINVVKKAQKN